MGLKFDLFFVCIHCCFCWGCCVYFFPDGDLENNSIGIFTTTFSQVISLRSFWNCHSATNSKCVRSRPYTHFPTITDVPTILFALAHTSYLCFRFACGWAAAWSPLFLPSRICRGCTDMLCAVRLNVASKEIVGFSFELLLCTMSVDLKRGYGPFGVAILSVHNQAA